MGFTTNAHLLALTYFIVVACREGVRLSSSAKEKYLAEPTNINELKELWYVIGEAIGGGFANVCARNVRGSVLFLVCG